MRYGRDHIRIVFSFTTHTTNASGTPTLRSKAKTLPKASTQAYHLTSPVWVCAAEQVWPSSVRSSAIESSILDENRRPRAGQRTPEHSNRAETDPDPLRRTRKVKGPRSTKKGTRGPLPECPTPNYKLQAARDPARTVPGWARTPCFSAGLPGARSDC